MRIFGMVLVVVCASSAQGQLRDFQTNFTGTVNGGAVEATGTGVLDLNQTGMSQARIDFGSIPSTFDPLSASLISNLCSNAFRDPGSPDNLYVLGGGNYSTSRTFQWIGLPGSILQIDSTVTNSGGGADWISNSVISGTYNGPTDIVGIRDYSITWLPSSTPGEFFEAGTMVLERATGDTLILQFASIFSGLANDLSEPQFGTGAFNTSFDGTTLLLEWDGEFYVPAPATGVLMGMMGLAATRRRR
ncbi:MAG: hypothetical protein KDA31_06105 [Phycisphaerales bacterium]|nr:hypothetical protein [Phycisphaerales bacterium]MCB9837552.1 hypothetical protein [Phycisphaera sp.]